MKIHSSLERYFNQETKEFECLNCHNKFIINNNFWSECKNCSISFGVNHSKRTDEINCFSFNVYINNDLYKVYQFYDDPIEFAISKNSLDDIFNENIIVDNIDFNNIEDWISTYILFS